MVQNNKVLTVSYGTFSCTLEGFEDSFDTMKAIAEYFRDLASDDRYFGAEPPQPDAEMLTRIARREIDRQVDARTSDGTVHLRASGPAAAPPVADQPVQHPPAEVVETVNIEAQDTAPTATAAEPAPVEIEAEAEPQQADNIDLTAVATAVATTDAPEIPPIEDIVATEVDDDDSEIGNDTVPAADSIAAKLQRIRAVVAQAPREEDFSEDEHAEIFITESAVDIAAAMRADDQDRLAEDDESQDQVEIAEALERIDQRLAAADAEQAETPTEIVEDAEPAEDVVTETKVEVDAITKLLAQEEPEVEAVPEAVPTVEAVEAEAEAEASIFEDLEETAEDDVLDDEDNILAQVAEQVDVSEDEAAAAELKTPKRARIVRVKRADIEQAIVSGSLEEIEEDEAQQPDLETSLSDADEADLLRELAVVEAELLATDEITNETPEAPEEPEAAKVVASPAPVAPKRPASETPDSDVSRLMAAADEKLEDPESSSSRETYDHLRAAMAAAQADKAAGGSVGSGVRDDEYREDLASVVRPRRPAAAKAASRRPAPAAQRAAPLKLVAEQRIDEEPKKAPGPVRPRRIASAQADDAEFADKGRKGGFSEYASESGAVELPELLEAAASYMSFIEGRDHFSRPQLMNKVKQLDSPDFNREDGLRSFGQLLREGKIEKTQNGKFTASGQIGFRPGQRAVG